MTSPLPTIADALARGSRLAWLGLAAGCAPTAEAWLHPSAQLEISPQTVELGFVQPDGTASAAVAITNVGPADASLSAAATWGVVELSERSWTASPGETVGLVLTLSTEDAGVVEDEVVVLRNGAQAAVIPVSATVTASAR